jgi:demethylmenaquinone methyltransferase/2-methoxy-6-polyprenyl-1,4-benzoquinol methylase
MNDPLLREQIEYYRARAQEYEATALPDGADDEEPTNPFAMEWRGLVREVEALPQSESILELACGTGVWTQELVKHTEYLTALDAAPEMLKLNRARVNDPRVRYDCVNLFEWEPTEQYDLVFFAFWLSHVPLDRLDLFLQRVRRAVKPGGRVMIFDEPRGSANVIPTQGHVQARTLNDGRTFSIVKEYYDPEELRRRLRAHRFSDVKTVNGNYFFRATALG